MVVVQLCTIMSVCRVYLVKDFSDTAQTALVKLHADNSCVQTGLLSLAGQ